MHRIVDVANTLHGGVGLVGVRFPNDIDHIGRDLSANILHVNELLLALLYTTVDSNQVCVAFLTCRMVTLLPRQKPPTFLGRHLKALLEKQDLRQRVFRVRFVEA